MELKTRELLEAGIKEGIVNMGVNMGGVGHEHVTCKEKEKKTKKK